MRENWENRRQGGGVLITRMFGLLTNVYPQDTITANFRLIDTPTLTFVRQPETLIPEDQSERKGQSCRVLCHEKLNSILVEFGDGFRVVTSRYAARKII
jgi:hypothetical protein